LFILSNDLNNEAEKIKIKKYVCVRKNERTNQ
jgi:hypothetical protein